MGFRENNNGGSKRAYKSEHVYAANVFYDEISNLYTVTNIHHKTRPGFY